MPATVLVVEDDKDLLRLLMKYLRLEGFTPAPATNGREALDYLRGGGNANVILLDLRMPVMDGWAFRRAQRDDPDISSIPVVVLSGIEADHVQDLEVAASIQKPVSFPEIASVVRRLCPSA